MRFYEALIHTKYSECFTSSYPGQTCTLQRHLNFLGSIQITLKPVERVHSALNIIFLLIIIGYPFYTMMLCGNRNQVHVLNVYKAVMVWIESMSLYAYHLATLLLLVIRIKISKQYND